MATYIGLTLAILAYIALDYEGIIKDIKHIKKMVFGNSKKERA